MARDRTIRIIRPDTVRPYEPGGHAGTENRRLLRTDHVEVILGRMTKGGTAQGHLHRATDQILFILDGTASVVREDGHAHDFGPGTLQYIPAGTPHGGTVPLNRTDKPLSFLVIYTPPLDPSDLFPAPDDDRVSATLVVIPERETARLSRPGLKTGRRKLLETETLEISVDEIAKGELAAEHGDCEDERIIYVIDGAGSLVTDREPRGMEAGTLVFIPPGVPCSVTGRMGTALKFLVLRRRPSEAS